MKRISDRRRRQQERDMQQSHAIVQERMRTMSALRLKPLNLAIKKAIQQQVFDAQRQK